MTPLAAGWLAFGVTRQVPTSAGYTVLLLLHVACAVVGFSAICTTGVQAARARRGPGGAKAQAVRRYFRPGPNWVGRALYGVPVFGFALIAASGGAFDDSDTFVVVGLALWLVAAVTAEVLVWPAERRIQLVVAEQWQSPDAEDDRPVSAAGAAPDIAPASAAGATPGITPPQPVPSDEWARRLARDCNRVAAAAAVLGAVFAAAVVLMVAKP
ncbi:MAG TPA: hypothetical protein VMR97_15085 [Acidimicrobiales bacterium]|nr:hypothetical protein [Acidimicrobiales bacterium]